MSDLLTAFEADVETLMLKPSQGGCFEVTVNGKLLYSKLQTKRHADPGEVHGLVEQYLKEAR